MSVLEKIAWFQHRRDEVPNQELARHLAETRNQEDITEIADNLWNAEPNIQSDCLKVLYELGYLAPELIAPYAAQFLKLITQRNNRLVWGGMIALSTIAALRADELFPHAAAIQKVMAAGSVITNDAGMKTLSSLAAHNAEYSRALAPYLLERLASARPVDSPRYAEVILPAMGSREKADLIHILQKWIASAPVSRRKRLERTLKAAEAIR